MNIFYVSREPSLAARALCDKHIVRMPLESAQMLSTALQRHEGPVQGLYKPCHVNHPCTLWAGDSLDQWRWLCEHGKALCAEYTKRYGKKHKSEHIIDLADRLVRYSSLPSAPFSDPPLCMYEECKIGDVVDSYREFYHQGKSYFAKWAKETKPPDWWDQDYANLYTWNTKEYRKKVFTFLKDLDRL